MLALATLLVSHDVDATPHDADTCTNGITLPKSHVAPHVNHFDLGNTMDPLVMKLALHDANVSAM